MDSRAGGRGDPKRLPPFFTFLADVDLQNTQKRNKQVCFSPDLLSDFSLFKPVNLCLLSYSHLAFFLLVADLAVVVVVAVDGSANAWRSRRGGEGSVSWARGTTAGLWAPPRVGCCWRRWLASVEANLRGDEGKVLLREEAMMAVRGRTGFGLEGLFEREPGKGRGRSVCRGGRSGWFFPLPRRWRNQQEMGGAVGLCFWQRGSERRLLWFLKGRGGRPASTGKEGKALVGTWEEMEGTVMARFWQRGRERPVPWRKWGLWFFDKGRGATACKEDRFFMAFFGF